MVLGICFGPAELPAGGAWNGARLNVFLLKGEEMAFLEATVAEEHRFCILLLWFCFSEKEMLI
jgi:hypothetical protein